MVMRATGFKFLLTLVAGLATGGLPSIAAAAIQFTADYQSIPSVTSVSSVKAIDVNGDGIPDLVVVGSSHAIWWHRGLPGGGYAPPAPLVSFPGIVTLWDAGDINNDGKIDFLAVDNTNTAWSVLGNGDGTFQAPRAILTEFWGACIRLGDLDGDGILDLVAAPNFGPLYTLKGLGDGRFQVTSTIQPPPYFPVDIAIADFDGDSRADVMLVDYPTTGGATGSTPGGLDFFHGLPGGLLDTPVVIPMPGTPTAVSVGDLDEDGLLDAMVSTIAGSQGYAAIVYGAPVGTPFGRLDIAMSGVGSLTAVDLDGDGHPELVATEANDQYGDQVEVFGRTGPRSYASLRDYAGGIGPRSPVFTDTNGDGRRDIVVCNPVLSQLVVLHGHGGLNYGDGEEVRTVQFTGLDVGDVNGDHIPDVVTVQLGALGVAGVHLGIGDGTFQPMSTTTGPQGSESAALVDLNRDGLTDLVGLAGFWDRLYSFLADGAGHFVADGYSTFGTEPHYSMAFADFNEDGHIDAAVPCVAGIAICPGASSGIFGSPTVLPGGMQNFVSVADFNRDGHADLVATRSTDDGYYDFGSQISVYLGHGDGSFTALPTFYGGYKPTSFAVGDVNGDGIPDLAVSNFGDNTIAIFLGVGDGTFVPGTLFAGVWAPSIALADVDGDGAADLIAIVPATASVRVWPGMGNGTFGTPSDFGTRSMADLLRVVDLNHDGSPDIVVAHRLSNLFDVLLNRSVGYAVPVLASNVEATVVGGHVRLVWYSVSSGLYLARVERASHGAWQDVGSVQSNRADYATFEEDVPDGEYDYRLAMTVSGQVERVGEVHVTVLRSASLAIEACSWSPSAGDFNASLSLEGPSPAHIQILDVSGRIVADDSWTPPTAGQQSRAVGARARPGPGVYWARLSQHGHSVSRRVVVLE